MVRQAYIISHYSQNYALPLNSEYIYILTKFIQSLFIQKHSKNLLFSIFTMKIWICDLLCGKLTMTWQYWIRAGDCLSFKTPFQPNLSSEMVTLTATTCTLWEFCTQTTILTITLIKILHKITQHIRMHNELFSGKLFLLSIISFRVTNILVNSMTAQIEAYYKNYTSYRLILIYIWFELLWNFF